VKDKSIEEHLRAIFRQVSKIATEEMKPEAQAKKRRAAKKRTAKKPAAKKREAPARKLSMTPGAIRIRALREAARAKLEARVKKESSSDPAEGVF